MDPLLDAVTVRRASGLPEAAVLRDPERAARVARLARGALASPTLPQLVRRAAEVAGAECAQLSLLSEQQVATAFRCGDDAYSAHTSALEDSLCTVTVLSGDVLVAADVRRHPWLHDLPPVVSGAVGSYLGVPLKLADGTVVGALCVYDSQPHDWSQVQVGHTCGVADAVAAELERLAAAA